MPKFEYRVNTQEALGWELHQKSLNWELVDQAELAGCDKYGPDFTTLEVDTRITIDGDDFVVTFEWGEDEPPATRRVRVSFDVLTRRAGSAELDIPTDTNVEEFLNTYLNKDGTGLVQNNLPAGVTLHQMDIQKPEHRIETDWVEDAAPAEQDV